MTTATTILVCIICVLVGGAALALLSIATENGLFILWRKAKPAKKELTVDDVLKAADDTLAFDPLKDARERPKAVQPLLSVLLAIREKKAEQELRDEASAYIRPKQARTFSDVLRYVATDALSGGVGPTHPHYCFTEAGRAAARHAEALQAQADAQKQMADMERQLAEAAQQRPLGISGYVNSPPYQG